MRGLFFVLCLALFPGMSFADIKMDSLSVEVSPLAQDQYMNFNFGNQFLHSRSYLDLTLTANGPNPVHVRGVVMQGSEYEAYTNCPAILYPGQRCMTTVYFVPRYQGTHWGELNFLLRDHRIVVQLVGYGIR